MTLNKGIFTISFDTELAWGSHGNPKYMRAYRDTRSVVAEILSILNYYHLSATWAVVGELFLEQSEQNDVWHAPDMIRSIMECPTSQEVGCHSFSHITHQLSCDAACFDRELERCRKIAQEWSINLESFVYPRNVIKFSERLAAYGFRIFRERDNTWYNGLPGILRRIGHVFDAYCWPYAPVGDCTHRHGIFANPGNQLLLHRMGWARFLPVSFQVRKAIHGMQRAARERKIFHLWTHPFNLATDPKHLIPGFQKICAYAARLRDEGILENMTMGELTHHHD